ncbi:hypothetical protein U7230_03930 [Carboxydochorda subterranea]|uniref:Uncharacterized protein n=1 Tax=Carboxydichorda subterranea TaxID=3109565 RepID=A0ABZ1C1I5_9FIRM|nr:hypothetical protein [Limnochorda sp. L945t]WRP18163.1 hypothetical protein U7230_03930 [Limnochorda sp. L945t]
MTLTDVAPSTEALQDVAMEAPQRKSSLIDSVDQAVSELRKGWSG